MPRGHDLSALFPRDPYNAWRESPGYTERERAALAWTEAVTLLTEGLVPDEVYQAARKQFSEAELAHSTLAVATINACNRMSIAFRTPAGHHRPSVKAGVPVG